MLEEVVVNYSRLVPNALHLPTSCLCFRRDEGVCTLYDPCNWCALLAFSTLQCNFVCLFVERFLGYAWWWVAEQQLRIDVVLQEIARTPGFIRITLSSSRKTSRN